MGTNEKLNYRSSATGKLNFYQSAGAGGSLVRIAVVMHLLNLILIVLILEFVFLLLHFLEQYQKL